MINWRRLTGNEVYSGGCWKNSECSELNSEVNRYTRLDDTQAINREYLLSRGQRKIVLNIVHNITEFCENSAKIF